MDIIEVPGACALFILVVLGTIARLYGFGLLRFIRYMGAETLLVLGTCSSESVLPRLMGRLNRLGCSKSSVGLVLPIGYSFNADGTAIYLSMASLLVRRLPCHAYIHKSSALRSSLPIYRCCRLTAVHLVAIVVNGLIAHIYIFGVGNT